MATRLTTSTLRVTIEEDLTLNGVQQGTTNVLTIPSIAEVSRRIISVPASEVTIVSMSTAVSAGTFAEADVRYIRFTNLDTTNFITLTFRNQDNDEFAVKLDAGQSFVLNGDNDNGMTAIFNATQDADAASDTAFGSLTNIQADANGGSCNLEMIVASV